MQRRFLKAAALLGAAAFLGLVVYLLIQWTQSDPLSIRVMEVTTNGNKNGTLRLEIKNTSPFPVTILDGGSFEGWPISWFHSDVPTVYAFQSSDPKKRTFLLKSGQMVERELKGFTLGTPFEGGLRYSWEPTSAELLRRITNILGNWKPESVFGYPLTNMRESAAGPVCVPAPEQLSGWPPPLTVDS